MRKLVIGLVALLLVGCSDQGVMFVTLEADDYSVPRYVDYPSVRLVNVTNTSSVDLVNYEVTARCEEHTFESLTHVFQGVFTLPAGETADLLIPYERGYPYFTDLRVECNVDVPTKFGQAMVNIEYR